MVEEISGVISLTTTANHLSNLQSLIWPQAKIIVHQNFSEAF